jgi:hypothetical protein
VAGRPVAHIGPLRRNAWVSAARLRDLLKLPADPTVASDLAGFEPACLIRGTKDSRHLGADRRCRRRRHASVARGELGLIESCFRPLPLDDNVVGERGRLQAAVPSRHPDPREPSAGLVIAASANTRDAALLTDQFATHV